MINVYVLNSVFFGDLVFSKQTKTNSYIKYIHKSVCFSYVEMCDKRRKKNRQKNAHTQVCPPNVAQ